MREKEVYKKEIRLLKANEIECRVGTMKDDGSGCSLLLYKDARVDMKLLDEIYGPMNWKREHQVVNDNLYCTISIWDYEKNQWVSKQDVGVESYTEKEKGQASDAFKRAGFNWGLGRELYTAPFIWIKLEPKDTRTGGTKRYLDRKFSVKHIAYNVDREINELVIVDEKGNIRYTFGNVKEKVEVKSPKKIEVDGVYNGALLEIAIKEMRAVKNIEELNIVWNKFISLHNNTEFRNITMEMGSKYKK